MRKDGFSATGFNLRDGKLLPGIWACMLELAIRLRECKENIHFASIMNRVRDNLVVGSKGGNRTGKGDKGGISNDYFP